MTKAIDINFEILTDRYTNDRDSWLLPSWDVIYEWEDVFSGILKIPIASPKKREIVFEKKYTRKLFSIDLLRHFLQFINSFSKTKRKKIAFEILLKRNFSFSNDINSIPIIIDFWNNQNATRFCDTYKNCSLICISSLEVINYLKKKKCTLNIQHLPLSISDIYKIDVGSLFEKKYDVVLAGRKNEILWGFLQKFEKKFPNVEYVYQERIDGEFFYKSNKSGVIGTFNTRKEYIDLLKMSKVGFYSTPGIDGGEKRTGGFNPVTPRYLELLASGCLLMGRYPDNEETRFYELEKFCPNINTYEEFEDILSGYLNIKGPDMLAYSQFLDKHYTSNRAYQLKEYLGQIFDY